MSTASRVVPGVASTTTRSSPSSALTREDLPTFGLPTSATRTGAAPASSGARGLREGLQDLGHHVVEADRVLRRDRVDPVDAEAVEVERERLAGRAVHLVGEHEDRAREPRQHRARQLLVERRQALDGVGHEEDDVGVGERGGGLVADLDRHRVVGEEVEAAGVDDRERHPVPLRDGVLAVAGDPGLVVDDGLAPPHEAVEERGLADVRPADDGHDGQPGRALCVMHVSYTSPFAESSSSAARAAAAAACSALLRLQPSPRPSTRSPSRASATNRGRCAGPLCSTSA